MYDDYGKTYEDGVATLQFQQWFNETFYPDKQMFNRKDFKHMINVFQQVIINLSLAKGRAVTRQEASDYITNKLDNEEV
jgi:hypothetical protein